MTELRFKEPEYITDSVSTAVPSLPLTCDVLISTQRSDPSLIKSFAAADKDASKCGESTNFLLMTVR